MPRTYGVAVTKTAVNHVDWSIPFGFDQATLVESPTRWLLCSGQTSIGPDGAVQHPGDMGAQLADAMANLEALLAAAGMTLDDVVRVTAYVTDMDAFITAPRDERTQRWALTLIGVQRLAYPELMVELEAIACS
jgi:enamine deaminase RidA (YjgF/YER057c/UK114 family)